jgi:hypothetical protein
MRRLLLLLLLCFPLLAWAAPRAWLDRDSLRLGETVTLNVETDARGVGEPDFSALDADFRRLGTSSSTQLSIVNGRQSARTLWAVALEPRAEGTFTIPAFALGTESTQPLTVTVLPMPSGGSAAAGDEVFLEIDATPADPYVQQQVSYVVRLYYSVTLLEGQLQEPQVSGAQVTRLGQDVTYQKTIDGDRYMVVERRYAVVPETSGRLEIPGPRFAGRALRSGFNALGANSVLNAAGNAVTLEVKPRPPAARTPWLPARSMELHDESGNAPATLKVGEPLTLTLRLVGQGVSAEQLPELQLPKIDGAEIYPDQETPTTSTDGEWLRGERVRKFALVPTRPGRIELPQVQIDWWDVRNDRAATTSLPARFFEVEGSAMAAPPVPAPAAAQDAGTSATAPAAQETAAPSAARWLWPALAALFAGLWIATLLWRRRTAPPAAAASEARPVVAPRADWRKSWPQALHAGDAKAAAAALIAAAQTRDAQARNLGDVANLLEPAAQREAVLGLEHALYRGGDRAVALAALGGAFADGPRWRAATAAAKRDDGGLPPLYPER